MQVVLKYRPVRGSFNHTSTSLPRDVGTLNPRP